MKPGNKVKVIRDTSGHGVRMGTILTIRQINPKEQGQKQETICVKENTQYYYIDDLALINLTTKPEHFIITDPSSIIHMKFFNQLLEPENLENSIKEITFPLKANYNANTKTEIIIHKIEETPYGNGACSYGKYEIETQSRMLCIAENPYGWIDEPNGAAFKTLEEAENEFPAIIKKF